MGPKRSLGVRTIRTVLAALLVASITPVLALAVPSAPVLKRPASAASEVSSPKNYVPGEVIVSFKDGTSGRARWSAHRGAGAEDTSPIPGTEGTELVTLAPGESVKAAVKSYARWAQVELVQPNYIYEADLIPSDDLFDQLWGLHNTGQTGGTPDADIDAPEAWDLQSGEASIVVAVVDTGIDVNHPDLFPNLWVNLGEIPFNGLDDDSNGFIDDINGYDFLRKDADPNDEYGHGTHVSGTIAAAKNDLGVVGVAFGARIMALKFLDDQGRGSTVDAIKAIDYATQMGADVINCSWGGDTFDQALYDAMAAFEGPIVCSAGNGGSDGIGDNNDTDPAYPASYDLPQIISVASTDDDDIIASGSNFGTATVDLAAPGVRVLSTVPGGERLFDVEKLSTLYADDFSDLDSWDTSSYAQQPWTLDTDVYDSPPSSAAHVGYVDDEDSLLVSKVPVDLSSVTAAGMSFRIQYDLEAGYDWVRVWASNETSWTYLAGYSGTSAGFVDYEVDLSSLAGETTVTVAFELISDGSISSSSGYDGVYLDDMEIFESSALMFDPMTDLSAWETTSYAGKQEWALSTDAYTSPPTCAANTPYLNDEDSWLVLGNPVDLSGVTEAALTYRLDYYVQQDKDFVRSWVSTDQVSWVQVAAYTGFPHGWLNEEVDLTPWAGQPEVYVAFSLDSDASIVSNNNGFSGGYIDDVAVRKGTWGDPDYSTAYATYSGTSMAAPHVAGAAALMLSADASLTTAEVKQIIMDTVDPISGLTTKVGSGGRLNVNRALLADWTPPVDPSLSSTSHMISQPSSATTVAVALSGATDDKSGVDGFSVSWSQVATEQPDAVKDYEEIETLLSSPVLADGSWYVHVRTVDAAQNWSDGVTMGPFVIDTTPPVASSLTIAGGATYTSSTEVTVSSAVTDVSEMRFDAGSGFGPWAPYADEATVTLSGADGVKTVTGEYRDAALNIAELSDSIWLDTIAPSGPALSSPSHTVGAPSWDNTVDLVLSGASDAASGVDGFSVLWSQNTTTQPDAVKSNEETETLLVSPALADGSWYANVRTVDAVGNWSESTDLGPFVIDTVYPVKGDLVLADGAVYTSSTEVAASSSVTGASEMRFNGGSGFGPWVPYADEATVTLSGGDGVRTVTGEYRDAASNTISLADSIQLDTTAPNDPALSSPSHTASVPSRDTTVTLTLSGASDGDAGVDGFSVSWSLGATEQPDALKDHEEDVTQLVSPVLADGSWYANVRTVDVLGNWSTGVSEGPFVIDTIAPTVADDHVALYVDQAEILLTALDSAGVASVTYTLDGSAPITVPGSAATVSVSSLGPHALSYAAQDVAGNVSSPLLIEFTIVRADVQYEQIEGPTRYETAVEASKDGFPAGTSTAVVATGRNWPDALGGAALAGAVGGPVLLTAPDSLPSVVRSELQRLDVSKVYILGGTGAVGSSVEAELEGMLGSAGVERLGGPTRYSTTRLIAEETISLLGGSFDGTVMVATGSGFPDALSGSPLGYANGWPLVLVAPDGSYTLPSTAEKAVILGGTGAVSTVTEFDLKSDLDLTKVERVSGANRYGTAAETAKYGVAGGMQWSGAGLATGATFPDALSGGALLGSRGSVMLLTRPAALPPEIATVLVANRDDIVEFTFLGGEGAVSSAVRTEVKQILQ